MDPTSKSGGPGDGGATRDLSRVHLWQVQAVRDVAVFGAVVGLIYVGYLMRVVMTPVLVGLALAYLFEPVVRRLSLRTGRVWATAIVTVGIVLGIGVPLVGAGGVAVVQSARMVGEVRENWPTIRKQIEHTLEKIDRAQASLTGEEVASLVVGAESAAPGAAEEGGAEAGAGGAEKGESETAAAATSPSVLDRLEGLLFRNPGQLGRTIAGGGRTAVLAGWGVATSMGTMVFMAFFLTPFFFFFWSVGLGRAYSLGSSLIPSKNRTKTVDVLQKMDRAISGFVRGRITIAAVLAVLFTIGWWAIGVPAPVVLGVATGVLSIVPYLALLAWPTAIASLWIAEAGSGTPMEWWLILLLPTLVYWGLQAVDDYALTPVIQGKETGLDTPTIMVAVLGAGALGGVYGVLLAIPAAACVKILVIEVVWPRYKSWAEGQARDPLPFGGEDRAT